MFSIVGAQFAHESDAREALAALSQTPEINGTTIYQISLVKVKDGEIKLCDNFTSDKLTAGDSSKGSLIGGLVGLLSGPLSALLGGVAGSLLGGVVDSGHKKLSQELIAQVASKMSEGDMGLLMTVEEADENILDHMLVKYNNMAIYRFDAEAIAKEVEEAKKLAEQED